jgi:hypothetical protein
MEKLIKIPVSFKTLSENIKFTVLSWEKKDRYYILDVGSFKVIANKNINSFISNEANVMKPGDKFTFETVISNYGLQSTNITKLI